MRQGLHDTYCSAQHDQCSLIIHSFLIARRSGCGPASSQLMLSYFSSVYTALFSIIKTATSSRWNTFPCHDQFTSQVFKPIAVIEGACIRCASNQFRTILRKYSRSIVMISYKTPLSNISELLQLSAAREMTAQISTNIFAISVLQLPLQP